MKIEIPKPCTVPLSDMTPVTGGKYCDSCAHTVMDFSGWSKERIQAYFKNNTGKTCGIFTEDQLHVPEPIIHIPAQINYTKLTFTQRFLCALLICFGSWLFSCNTNDVVASTETSTYAFLMKENTTCSKETTDIEENPERRTYGAPMVYYPEQDEKGVWKNLDDKDMPQFPGGHEGLASYMKDHLHYPALPKGIHKALYVQFTVNKDGYVENPIVLQTDFPPFVEKEIMRVLKGLPKWKPARHDGKNVASYYDLPIRLE